MTKTTPKLPLTQLTGSLYKWALVCIFLALIAIPIFLHLDRQPIRIWDESRLAVNAFEMNKNGNYLVPYFEGAPEMWSTKPPLMIWLQVLFIKLIGFNELALRLPSAIAALLTCLLLVGFSYKYLKSYIPGVLAALVLVTTNGYIDIHGARTGDYDALLTLFSTLFCVSAFLYAETNEKKWIHFFFAGIVLAVLTKSIQGLLFLPAIAVYFLIQKKLIGIIKNPTVYIDALIAVNIIAGYYLLRERYNPGYIMAVWNNELGARYLREVKEDEAGAYYYIPKMIYYSFPYWIWFIPFGVASGFIYKSSQIKKLSFYLLLLTVSYFLIISFSKTKFLWYTIPLFPLLSFLIALFLYSIILRINKVRFNNLSGTIIFFLFLFIIFFVPYNRIARKVYNPTEYSWDKNIYPIGAHLQDAYRGNRNLNNHIIVYKDFNTHLLVYVKALQDKGQRIRFKQAEELLPGDTVIASEEEVIKTIQEKYKQRLLKQEGNVHIYQIE